MNKFISYLFIINGLILSLGFGLGSTPLLDLNLVFVIYLILTFILILFLINHEPINKKRFFAISTFLFFIIIALINTFIRSQFNPVSGWPSLTCFLFFSLLFIFEKSFNENATNIIKFIIIGLFLQCIYLLASIDTNLFGINELGQSFYENQVREDMGSNIEKSYNKNYLAKFFFYPLFFLALFRIQKKKLDFFNILLLSFSLFTAFLLASIKLLIAGLIGLLIYFFSRYNMKYLIFVTIIFTISMMLFDYNILNIIFEKKLNSFFNDNPGSRLNLIIDGLEISTHSFFGSGLGYSRLQINTYTHNTIVETFISIGLFFGFLFFVYIFWIARKCYKVLYNKILFTCVAFLSLFQSIYFDFFLLPVILCFISLALKNE